MVFNRTYHQRARRHGMGKLLADAMYQPWGGRFDKPPVTVRDRRKLAAEQLELFTDDLANLVRSSDRPLADIFPEAYPEACG